MKVVATLFTALGFAKIASASSTASSTNIRYCNRGFCYTRREPERHGLDHDIHHMGIGGNKKKGKALLNERKGLDFCTDTHGHVMDCELFSILGMDGEEIESQYEALEPIL